MRFETGPLQTLQPLTTVPTYTLTTLGCKVNQYDSCALAAALESAGLTRAGARSGSQRGADLVAVNTCCVTRTAMRKSRQAIRRAVRSAPGAAVIVVGCYSNYDARRLAMLLTSLNVPPQRCVVAGHHDDDLPEQIRHIAALLSPPARSAVRTEVRPDRVAGVQRNDGSMNASRDACLNTIIPNSTIIKANRDRAIKRNLSATRRLPPIREFFGHQRAFVKVQDGCDALCTYCIVPYARSVVWSRPADQVVRECRQLVAAGHKEIVLAGVFLGAYGRDTAVRKRWPDSAAPLIELVRRVAAIEGLWRLRLSSLEPGDLTDDLLGLWRRLPNLAPHFHLPLQSGSPGILKAMNRQYSPEQFARTVRRVRQVAGDAAITTDIIVGFPGESDDDFQQTLDLAREAGFVKIHAFPFSAIEGTAAWTRRGDAPSRETVKRRLVRLGRLEGEMARAYRGRLVGRTMEALVESTVPAPGMRQGMTDRYQTVRFACLDDLTGQVVHVHIDGATGEGLSGTLVDM